MKEYYTSVKKPNGTYTIYRHRFYPDGVKRRRAVAKKLTFQEAEIMEDEKNKKIPARNRVE